MSTRLWYPQLDVYDAIRRIACLATRLEHRPPSIERTYIFDFYLANPGLLHKVHMPREVRSEFGKVGIQHPDDEFLSYPAAPILFKKMEPIQKEAVRTLAGKELIDLKSLDRGEVTGSQNGRVLFRQKFQQMLTQPERDVLHFIAEHFSKIGLEDIRELRSRTGLRRMAG